MENEKIAEIQEPRTRHYARPPTLTLTDKAAEDLFDSFQNQQETQGKRNFVLASASLIFLGVILVFDGLRICDFDLSDFILHRLIWLVGGIVALQKTMTTHLFGSRRR